MMTRESFGWVVLFLLALAVAALLLQHNHYTKVMEREKVHRDRELRITLDSLGRIESEHSARADSAGTAALYWQTIADSLNHAPIISTPVPIGIPANERRERILAGTKDPL